jgi:SAM-dependent methyltransferase
VTTAPPFDHRKYDTDRHPDVGFEPYDSIFERLRHADLSLLEIGVDHGGSLLLWRDYFPRGKIVGIDQVPVALEDAERRIRIYTGRQEDTEFLSHVAHESAPGGFDIIIDDASHVGGLTRMTFWHLFERHLKPGGIYAIEDWGTGYWSDWEDGNLLREGEPHQAGMVGFVKELVDEQARGDHRRTTKSGPTGDKSRFESVLVTDYIVFVTKRRIADTPLT